MLAAGSPVYNEEALVLADSLPPPTAPDDFLPAPKDLLTKMGVSYLTSENPLDCIVYLFESRFDLFYFTLSAGLSLVY